MGYVHPCAVKGSGNKEIGVMTVKRQLGIIKQFADGVFNLLISTAALVQEIFLQHLF